MVATALDPLLLGCGSLSGSTNMAEDDSHLQSGAAATGHDGLG
jgi:hypothetical protein